MGAGGWNLVHMWLTDGILAKNWALIQELLELLLLCPVDIERLKSNNCPKLIKGLSKEGSHQGVRILASRLVEQWLKIVKGEAAPNSVPAQIVTLSSSSIKPTTIPTAIVHPRPVISTIQSSSCSTSTSSATEKNETDVQIAQNNCLIDAAQENQEPSNDYHRITEKTFHLPIDNKQSQCSQQKKQSFVVVPSSQSSLVVPVYKITIRDGKQVLTKVDTDSTNIINISNSEINGDIHEFQNNEKLDDYSQNVENTDKTGDKEETTELPSSVNEITTIVNAKENSDTIDSVDKIKDNKSSAISSENNKSANDKENRDFTKKDNDKKIYNSSSSSSTTTTTATVEKTEKKSSHHSSSSKSSSKHSSSHRSSSNSHRSSSSSSSSSSHRSKTSKDKTKDKHHNNTSSNSSSSSSSSKHSSNSKSRSERDKEKQEREREKQKKDQAEKDKATLEKVQGPALTSKLGKIPKKKTDEPNDINVKRNSTDSKEMTKKNLPIEKKNISISIENRKIQDSTRPKTVKTFNSKFRSTGLEEEAKPPPPRSARKPNIVVDKPKILSTKISSLKRPSPLRESSSSADKKARLMLDNSVTPPNDEKKGGIKLIKPKRKYE